MKKKYLPGIALLATTIILIITCGNHTTIKEAAVEKALTENTAKTTAANTNPRSTIAPKELKATK